MLRAHHFVNSFFGVFQKHLTAVWLRTRLYVSKKKGKTTTTKLRFCFPSLQSLFGLGDHSFSTYAKLSENRVRNVSFSENFAYVQNE